MWFHSADGKPADNLEVEDIGNDEVLVGDPALDAMSERDETFDNNIAEEIDENDLNKKAQDLIGYFDSDKESRSDWEERYKQGLETLEPDGGMVEEEEQRATRGLSTSLRSYDLLRQQHNLMQERSQNFIHLVVSKNNYCR